MWQVILLIILIIILIVIPKPRPFVVLYSTGWREWETTIENQMKLIERFGEPIFGIHYWSKMPIWRSVETNGTAPDEPPMPVRNWEYKHTITDQTPEFLDKIKKHSKTNYTHSLGYMIESTKIALENAEEVYTRKFGHEMPDDTVILRLRPDVLVNVDKFPNEIPKGDNFYISNWHRTARPEWNAELPEAGDIICLTTKKVLKSIVNTPIEDIERICNPDNKLVFTEHYLYSLLKYNNVEVINHPDMHISLQRSKDEIEVMS
jgi:hypothetical protein